MTFTPTTIPDVLLIEPRVFEDERGFFYESFNARRWHEGTGFEPHFVQDNHSRSVRGVLRGLHYQRHQPQGKLVRVVVGEIFDVAVDLRRSSPTFGQWVGARLSAANHRQLYIPEGFAHGFLTLSGQAEVLYKATAFYTPGDERSIIWNDAELAIVWPGGQRPLLSAKDACAPAFTDADYFP
jgi:dTDP-4-dehydrorhamnose 3,5-epimerase